MIITFSVNKFASKYLGCESKAIDKNCDIFIAIVNLDKMLKCVDAHVNNDVEKMRSQKISVKSKNPVRFVKPNRTLGDLKM